jgi:hypothetical protein
VRGSRPPCHHLDGLGRAVCCLSGIGALCGQSVGRKCILVVNVLGKFSTSIDIILGKFFGGFARRSGQKTHTDDIECCCQTAPFAILGVLFRHEL